MPISDVDRPTTLIPLNLALLAVQGVDAVKFLQGQVTCDVRDLSNSNSDIQKILLGAQCNNKGRVLTVFHAFQLTADCIYLLINNAQVESTVANLRKYAVFFKLAITDVSADWKIFLQTENTNNTHLNSAQEYTWHRDGNRVLLQLDSLTALTLVATTDAKNHLAISQQDAENLWASKLINAGVPDVYPDTQALFTPQDINLPLVGGVNFRKGCYTGQEIVARLHYKATLKRHMYRFEFESADFCPASGTKLIDANAKPVGEIVVAARRDANYCELLASISDHAINDALIEGAAFDGGKQKLRPISLPYAIPTDKEETSSQ